jgi:hypothetical protein
MVYSIRSYMCFILRINEKIIFDISVSMIILTLLIVCMTIRSLLDKSINISYPLLDNGGVSFSHLIPL